MQIKITGKWLGKETIIVFFIMLLIIVLVMLWLQQRAILSSMERIEAYLGKAFASVEPQDMRQMARRIRLLSYGIENEETRLLAVLICTEAKRNKVPPMLVFWLIRYESGFNSQARSEKNCLGYIQLNPQVFPYPEAVLLIPAVNIALGARHFAGYLHQEHGDKELAVRRYHGNPLAPRSIDLGHRVMEGYRGKRT